MKADSTASNQTSQGGACSSTELRRISDRGTRPCQLAATPTVARLPLVTTGAYRDGSAALERVLLLERTNDELRQELDAVRGRLVRENAELRERASGPENQRAVMRRIIEERDELLVEVRALRAENSEFREKLNRLSPYLLPGNPLARLLSIWRR